MLGKIFAHPFSYIALTLLLTLATVVMTRSIVAHQAATSEARATP